MIKNKTNHIFQLSIYLKKIFYRGSIRKTDYRLLQIFYWPMILMHWFLYSNRNNFVFFCYIKISFVKSCNQFPPENIRSPRKIRKKKTTMVKNCVRQISNNNINCVFSVFCTDVRCAENAVGHERCKQTNDEVII